MLPSHDESKLLKLRHAIGESVQASSVLWSSCLIPSSRQKLLAQQCKSTVVTAEESLTFLEQNHFQFRNLKEGTLNYALFCCQLQTCWYINLHF